MTKVKSEPRLKCPKCLKAMKEVIHLDLDVQMIVGIEGMVIQGHNHNVCTICKMVAAKIPTYDEMIPHIAAFYMHKKKYTGFDVGKIATALRLNHDEICKILKVSKENLDRILESELKLSENHQLTIKKMLQTFLEIGNTEVKIHLMGEVTTIKVGDIFKGN